MGYVGLVLYLSTPLYKSFIDFHFGTGFDPDVCSATKGFVRSVDNLGRTVDRDPVSVGVAFVVLDREHGFVTAGLSVALYHMLVNVDAFTHLLAR